MVSTHRKRLVDCINVSWHMHGLLYFHAYSKLPCTVQQFATLLGLAWFPVPLPYVHDTWYPNGNNRKPHFGGYFTFLVRSWKLISLLKHCVSTKITPHESINPRISLPAKARKFIPRNLVRIRYTIMQLCTCKYHACKCKTIYYREI